MKSANFSQNMMLSSPFSCTSSDNALHSSIDTLIRTNKQLQDQLYAEKSKNYNLCELKRRLQEEINRLEYQLDHMKDSQALMNKELLIKYERTLQQNQKWRKEHLHFEEEIGRMREDMRELGRLYQVAKKEKEQLENQNSSLLRTVDDLKHKISNLQRKPSPEIQITSARYHSPTHACLGSGRKDPTPYQDRQTEVSAQIPIQQLKGKKFYSDHQQLTIPSQNYLLSPKSEAFSEECTFKNKIISRHIQPQTPLYDESSPSEQRQQQQTKEQQMKHQINILQGQIISSLQEHYTCAIEKAAKSRSNSLRLFMQNIQPHLQPLTKMTLNYLQAKHCLEQLMPQAPPQPYTDNNDQWMSKVYENVKQKSKHEKTTNAWYLGMFRLLTLVQRGESVHEQLINSIKHSCLKFLYRIGAGEEAK